MKRYFLERAFKASRGKSLDDVPTLCASSSRAELILQCDAYSVGNEADLGKLKVVDNLVDGVFYVVWAIRMLQYLEVETGIAVKVSRNNAPTQRSNLAHAHVAPACVILCMYCCSPCLASALQEHWYVTSMQWFTMV